MNQLPPLEEAQDRLLVLESFVKLKAQGLKNKRISRLIGEPYSTLWRWHRRIKYAGLRVPVIPWEELGSPREKLLAALTRKTPRRKQS